MRIGFMGLGNMGSAIARNLINAGHELKLYNRTRSRAQELASPGATVAETPAAAATDVDVVITMLADDRAVEEVLFGPGNVVNHISPGAIHISMGTISVSLSRRLAEAHELRRQHYLAAPVFGRPDVAQAAKLFVVASGPGDQVEYCRPIFEAIGQKTFHAGEDAPAANVIKLAGNFLITTAIEGLGEAFALCRKFNVAPDSLLQVLTESVFNAPVYRTYGAMIAADNFEPVGFKLPLGLKDNRLLLAAAEEAAVPMPFASIVRDRFLTAMANGMSESDWAAIARISYENAGVR